MSDSKVTDLAPATTPLSGTEVVYLVQGGLDTQATAQDIANLGGGGGAVDSVNGQTGVVVLDATDIGLGNVDNTSDANKPISTATQTALDAKQNDIILTTIGSSGPATLVGDTLNIPQYSGGGGGATTLTTAEINLGSSPRRAGKFTITGLSGLTISKPVSIMQAVGPYTGKGTRADEAEMDGLTVSGVVTSATEITAYWNAATRVKGNFKFNYFVGA